MKKRFFTLLLVFAMAAVGNTAFAQHSVARQWNEQLLGAIRKDFARPTVHARNLFHVSLAMYDAWAAYDSIAETFLLGKTVGGFTCVFNGVPPPADLEAARNEAISYAAYRVLRHRFQNSPGAGTSLPKFDNLMIQLGYNPFFQSVDYASGNPAALGNYIGLCVIAFGLEDGSNEQNGYANQFYQPVNTPLAIKLPGNPTIADLNRWQPLTLDVFIDQNGNVIPFNTPPFLSPEWGGVVPFSLKPDDLTVYQRNGHEYRVYHDPGDPPYLDTITVGGLSEEYKWNFSLVSIWSSQLDPTDGVMWDISPASSGNIQNYPQTLQDYHNFYALFGGGTPGLGYPLNPKTGQPYQPQIVPRGDYARVLAEFWADGPNSETPPGHWFTILNYVNDHPAMVKKFRGKGPLLDDLEWDVKAYLALGGALHDVAITAWGIKGWYDYVRPVSAIRGMAKKGQSSDPSLPSYHPAGIPLHPGYIELVEPGDPLAGANNEHVGKIKIYAWRGPTYISNPANDVAGVGWILAERWWPYQLPTFVTPPFAGFISGHSTYSRAAAEVLTALTGDPFFPGGMGEFHCPKNQFLIFEDGPSVNLTLQWATYRDASDQCSLSRIWGGIHPPVDDIPGRFIGMAVAEEAFALAENIFYNDSDQDGFFTYEDCDDHNAAVYPNAPELCDGLDNDCNGDIDEGLTLYSYYPDNDGDGFGIDDPSIESCLDQAPTGYADQTGDCDDQNTQINPGAPELCDGLDNNCNGNSDEDLPLYSYYPDNDGDGFGIDDPSIESCLDQAPTGYADQTGDCDDQNTQINPGAPELCDGLDNNCNGNSDEGLPLYSYYPDNDGDGFGNAQVSLESCDTELPTGYVTDNLDCDDNNPTVYPGATEIPDGLDNDCNGLIDDGINSSAEVLRKKWKLLPNPARDLVRISYEYSGPLNTALFRADGVLSKQVRLNFTNNLADLPLNDLPSGVYWVIVQDSEGKQHIVERLVKF